MILFKKSAMELAAHGFVQFEMVLHHKGTPEELKIKEVTKLHLKNFCSGFAGGLVAAGYDDKTIQKALKVMVVKLREEYNLTE